MDFSMQVRNRLFRGGIRLFRSCREGDTHNGLLYAGTLIGYLEVVFRLFRSCREGDTHLWNSPPLLLPSSSSSAPCGRLAKQGGRADPDRRIPRRKHRLSTAPPPVRRLPAMPPAVGRRSHIPRDVEQQQSRSPLRPSRSCGGRCGGFGGGRSGGHDAASLRIAGGGASYVWNVGK